MRLTFVRVWDTVFLFSIFDTVNTSDKLKMIQKMAEREGSVLEHCLKQFKVL